MRHCLRKTARAAVAALMGCVCALAACAPSEKGEVQAELVISDETHVVIEVTAGDPAYSLYDVLASFAENGEISMEGSESEYGFYITSVNGTQADTESYWAVYTTLETMDGVRYSADPSVERGGAANVSHAEGDFVEQSIEGYCDSFTRPEQHTNPSYM